MITPDTNNTTSGIVDVTTHDNLDYIYDYDESVASLPLPELIPVSLLYGLTLVFGLVGNSLVILSIVMYQRMRSITNIFLLSLASADLLLVMICVPVKCVAFYSFTWTMGEFLCKGVHFVQNCSMICSIMTLTVMSIERYIAIRFPLKSKCICTLVHARVVILGVWFLSFILATPILFGQIHKEVGVKVKGFWCLKEWSTPVYSQVYEMCMLIIMFIVPLVAMIFAYTGICIELRYVTYMRADMRSGSVTDGGHIGSSSAGKNKSKCLDSAAESRPCQRQSYVEDDKTKMQVVKMLIVVVILFAVCWGPILFNNVLVSLHLLPALHYGYLKPMRQAFNLMSYLNSCVNPVVYSFMSKNFRESFKYAFRNICGTRWPARTRHRTNISFTTRTTSLNRSKMYAPKGDLEKDVSNSSSDNYKVTMISNSEDEP